MEIDRFGRPQRVMKNSNIRSGEPATIVGQNFPLSSAARGRSFVIVNIPKGGGRTQLIRLGIMQGEVIKCVERLPGGTVVLEKNRQEIAIGSSLARSITVGHAFND